MNLAVKHIISVAVFFLFSASFIYAQKIKEVTHRDVSVHYRDSSVNATVLLEEKKIRLNTTIDYYWYQNNAIKVNQGGYKGRLLDGDYQVITSDGSLITKGEFKKGYRIGKWKTWEKTGKLATIYQWNKGYKNGNYELYVDGKVVEEGSYKTGNLHGSFLKYEAEEVVEKGRYKKGKLHGKIITYKNDTIFSVTKYKNGKEVVPKEKKTKEPKTTKEKTKKNKSEEAVEDTKTKEEEKETNKKWWKFWQKKSEASTEQGRSNETTKKSTTKKVKEPKVKKEKKLKKRKMIKAGALLYAMFLVIVISIITSSIILVNYYNNFYVLGAFKQDQLFQDVYSGINYGLVFNQTLPLNQASKIDLFADAQHEVLVTKKSWGAFYVISSKATWRNKKASKTALVGANLNAGEKTAIYLAEQNKPLSLTGLTIITGDCYLPESGVKRAYIEGKSFVGQRLINGIKKNSNKNLPPINKELIDENYHHFMNSNNDSIMDYEAVLEQDSIVNTFDKKTLVLYSPFTISLANKTIEGNVIIRSDRNIIIETSSNINNIICYAKGIIIEKNSSINAQFFAQDSIVVEENCQLNYPSVLAVLGKGNSTTQRKISIAENVEIKGSVFLYNENYDRKNQALVSVGNNSKITGQIYASEMLELKGEVTGGVFCNNFLLKTPSSVYQNHLMDVVIDRIALSEHFVGVALTEAIQQHQIIKWLN